MLEPPVKYELSKTEASQIRSLAESLHVHGLNAATGDSCDEISEKAAELPTGLRKFLLNFRNHEPSFGALVTGFEVDLAECGPTPLYWQDAFSSRTQAVEELQHSLVASLLGETFTWKTLQKGRMVQNLVPTPGEEQEQSGHGSTLLEWHTEDAFHSDRCDYLTLFGIQNPDMVPTTVSSVRDIDLSCEEVTVLSEPRFLIRPDNEHIRQLQVLAPQSESLRRILSIQDAPDPCAVLFGDSSDPYLRIDPYFMSVVDGDQQSKSALESIIDKLNRNQQEVTLLTGHLLIVDNYRAVHGRKAYSPRFDGTDRWIKKISVTRDLRKSRGIRDTVTARAL